MLDVMFLFGEAAHVLKTGAFVFGEKRFGFAFVVPLLGLEKVSNCCC